LVIETQAHQENMSDMTDFRREREMKHLQLNIVDLEQEHISVIGCKMCTS